MGTTLIISIILLLLWPWIVKWTKKFMMRRAEDALRRAMGMPSRKEEERMRAAQEKNSRADTRGRSRSRRRRPAADPHPARLMKQVAEDVEFTEIVNYSEEITVEGTSSSRQRRGRRPDNDAIIVEEQVTDAEFTEIKTTSSRPK